MQIKRIYRQEPSAIVRGCTSLEVVGGPKRFMRIWDGLDHPVEWGWSLSDANVLVWTSEYMDTDNYPNPSAEEQP